MLTSFVNDWLDALVTNTGRFAVSEAVFGNVADLESYVAMTGSRTRVFDYPLHYLFVSMSNAGASFDMRSLDGSGFTANNSSLSVPFVDNHDTDNAGALHSPVVNLKMLAYAFILLREWGYPCVFYKDYYEYGLGPQILPLLRARHEHAYGMGQTLPETDANVCVYARPGDATHSGLLLLLNDGMLASRTILTPFLNAQLTDVTGQRPETVSTDATGQGTFSVSGSGYAVWVPTAQPQP